MPVNDKSTNRRELDLQGLFFAVLAKYKLILFCAVLGASAMGYYRLRMVTPYYTATCKLYALNAQGITLNSSLLNIGSELKYDYEIENRNTFVMCRNMYGKLFPESW